VRNPTPSAVRLQAAVDYSTPGDLKRRRNRGNLRRGCRISCVRWLKPTRRAGAY